MVLSRIPAPSQLRAGPAREIEKFPSPGQLGRAPAERLFMVWLPKSSDISHPLPNVMENSTKSIVSSCFMNCARAGPWPSRDA